MQSSTGGVSSYTKYLFLQRSIIFFHSFQVINLSKLYKTHPRIISFPSTHELISFASKTSLHMGIRNTQHGTDAQPSAHAWRRGRSPPTTPAGEKPVILEALPVTPEMASRARRPTTTFCNYKMDGGLTPE